MNETIGSTIKKYYYSINKPVRVCFITAIICGLLAHAYALTNHLYNYDELWHTPTGFGTGVQMGRWGLSVLAFAVKRIFKDTYTIPLINGLITILCHIFGACLIVDILDIRDEFYSGVVGGLLVTFPSLVCRMFYMFTTHYYAVGFLVAVIGVWLFIKKQNNILCCILAILLVAFGTGVYQTNFAAAVCICLAYLISKYIKHENKVKDTIIDCIKHISFLILSIISYFVIHSLALKVTGLQMSSHSENYDTMGQMSAGLLVTSLRRCYTTFIRLFLVDVYGMNPNILVKIGFLVSIIIFVFVYVSVLVSKRNIFTKIVLGLMFLVIPVAVNLIFIMAASSGVMYSIMLYEEVFIFVIAIGCLEAIRNSDVRIVNPIVELSQKGKIYKLLNVVTACCMVLSIATYIWFANGNYLALEYTNVHDEAYYTVLMSQIKSVEGYRDDMCISLVGVPGDDLTNNMGSMIDKTFNLGGKAPSNVVAYSQWNIMTKVIGFNPEVRWSDEDEEYFRNLPEVKAMPVYPDDGSIKIIDDTVVVKFESLENY